MTYGRNKPITAVMNEKQKSTARRVFITGPNGLVLDVIFPMNPQDLQNAMVIVQELESNNLRKSFESNLYGQQYMLERLQIRQT